MKKVIQSPLWGLFVMASVLGCMPAIPLDVTFTDSNPRWSWEGQWEGRGGMTFDFVQEGSHISLRKKVLLSEVSMDAEVTGNRAVGTITTTNPDSQILASPPDSQGAAATLNAVASALNDVSQKLSGVPFPLSLVISDDGMFLKGEVSDPITHEITFRRIGSPAALTTEQRPSEVADEPDDDEEAASQSRTAGPEEAGLGILVQDLTASMAASIGLRNQDGALVVTVLSGEPAAQAGIRAGDVVVAVNGLPTRTAKALGTLIKQLRRGDRVTLHIRRKDASGGLQGLRLAAVLYTTQAPRAQASAPQMGAVPNAPTGSSQSSPPAGYYQCYRLTVLISANSCKLGDLQVDGQGNYSSTNGSGGTYVFDTAARLVSFSGGVLHGRIARAMINRENAYTLRMTESGRGLPAPNQVFGTFTFEQRRSGHRQ